VKLLLFISLFFHALLFAQEDVSSEFSYIQLENKTYTLKEITDKSEANLFSPLDKFQSNFGFTDDIFWIKVNSKNVASIKKQLILELKYPSIDYIDIYELKDQQLILKKELGDLRLYDKSTFMPNPNYEFSLSPLEEKIFFIKIRSTGSLNLGLSVQDTHTYNLSSSTQIKWLSFYFGAVFIMLMYNFIIYLIIRNRSFLYYVLFHVSYTLFALGLTGISYELFWPETPEINRYLLPVAMALTGAFSLLFTIHFLDMKKMSMKLYKFLYILVFISFIFSLLPVIIGYSISVQLISLMSFFIVITLFIISLYLVFYKKNKNALFYLIAWSFFLVGVGVAHLSNIGFIPSTIYTRFSSQIGSFFELLLLSIGLAYYYNRLRKEHLELTYTNDELLALSQTDVLTKSYNRRYFYEKVKLYFSATKGQKKEVALLMLDLDHFKNINDKYGHDVGDKVLISFVNICKTIIREDDIFARFGGEEFVLFLPHTDKLTALTLAKKINMALYNYVIISAPDLTVTVSIGISYNTFDLEKLLNESDKALYKAKHSGRNTVILYDEI